MNFSFTANCTPIDCDLINGGSITATSNTIWCLEDVEMEEEPIVHYYASSVLADNHTYIITNADSIILDQTDSTFYNFQDYEAGIYKLFGLAYLDDYVYEQGSHINTIVEYSECAELSDNAVEVILPNPISIDFVVHCDFCTSYGTIYFSISGGLPEFDPFAEYEISGFYYGSNPDFEIQFTTYDDIVVYVSDGYCQNQEMKDYIQCYSSEIYNPGLLESNEEFLSGDSGFTLTAVDSYPGGSYDVEPGLLTYIVIDSPNIWDVPYFFGFPEICAESPTGTFTPEDLENCSLENGPWYVSSAIIPPNEDLEYGFNNCGIRISPSIPLFFEDTIYCQLVNARGVLPYTNSVFCSNNYFPEEDRIVEFYTNSTSVNHYTYIITNADSIILDQTDSTFFNFQDYEPGQYQIFGLGYLGDLIYEVGSHINTIVEYSECADLSSNSKTVNILNPVIIDPLIYCKGFNGTYEVGVTVSGGYPELNEDGEYEILGDYNGTNSNFVLGPLTFGEGFTVIASDNFCDTTTLEIEPYCIMSNNGTLESEFNPVSGDSGFTVEAVDYFIPNSGPNYVQGQLVYVIHNLDSDGNGSTEYCAISETGTFTPEDLGNCSPENGPWYVSPIITTASIDPNIEVNYLDYVAYYPFEGILVEFENSTSPNSNITNNSTLKITSINPHSESNQLLINYRTNIVNAITISIYNANGRLAKQKTVEPIIGKNSCQFNLGSISTGMYFISLTNGTVEVTDRFFK